MSMPADEMVSTCSPVTASNNGAPSSDGLNQVPVT
jgi:hypothetical protein